MPSPTRSTEWFSLEFHVLSIGNDELYNPYPFYFPFDK